MEALRQDVLACLRRAAKPVPPHQVANVVGAHVADVYDELGYLVRHGAARRHHCDDAVLRYSAVARSGTAASAAAGSEPVNTPHLLRPRLLVERPAPMAESVLAAMGDEPMRPRAIAAAHGGLKLYQVNTALQVLRRRGAVRVVRGSTRSTLWQRVAKTQQAAP